MVSDMSREMLALTKLANMMDLTRKDNLATMADLTSEYVESERGFYSLSTGMNRVHK